jgi:hypothetical protein
MNNGKTYIGFTHKVLEKRIIEHNSASKNGSNYLLHKAIRKYGINSFNWECIFESFDKNYILSEMENYFILQNLTNLIELFKQVETIGIKCKLWSWHNEYVPFIKENDYLLSKFIKLKYEDTEFDSLHSLMQVHPKFRISTSGFLLNDKSVPDDHQTIECHKVIANSIINSIENDNTILYYNQL